MKEKDLNLIKELIERVKSEKPIFFKKLQGWIGGIASAVIIAIAIVNFTGWIDLGDKAEEIKNGMYFLLTLLGGGFGVTLLPTNKAELQDEKTKEAILKEEKVK